MLGEDVSQYRALEFAKLEQFHRLQTIELLSKHQDRNKVLQELVAKQTIHLHHVQAERDQQDKERTQLQDIQARHRSHFAQQLQLSEPP